MGLRSCERRVPTLGTSLDDGGEMDARVSIGAKLRAKLRNSIRRAFGSRVASSIRAHDEPIRVELFSIERLEQHAESLAAAQHTNSKPTTDHRLEKRLRDNEGALRTAYHATIAAVREEWATTPAADWLVDNFHVVEEQVRAIRIDLPPGFHRELPKLIDGLLKGYPVYSG
jgi:cyclic beta-1,2-glucan synthetase